MSPNPPFATWWGWPFPRWLCVVVWIALNYRRLLAQARADVAEGEAVERLTGRYVGP